MTTRFQATESRDLDAAFELLAETEKFARRTLARVRPFIDLPAGAPVLDLGAAQGASAIAYHRAGLASHGLEPFEAALAVSRELLDRVGVEIVIRQGSGEAMPYEDGSFQFVHANSVMEHVDDPWQVFREVYRTLRPGGGFLFSTTSAFSPRQFEIGRFPLFAWYPRQVQRAIMDWAVRERPWLVGYTTRPAIHWFKRREVQLALTAIGYRRVVSRWELRDQSGELAGSRKLVVGMIARSRPLRAAADMALGGVEYLAIR